MGIGPGTDLCPLVLRFSPVQPMGIGLGTCFYHLVLRFPPVRQYELDRAQVSVI